MTCWDGLAKELSSNLQISLTCSVKVYVKSQMPGEVQITRAADVKASGPQTEGMVRSNAFVDVSDQICSNREHPHH